MKAAPLPQRPTGMAPPDRSLALEMTFWRLEPLDELADAARRHACCLEGVVTPPAHCTLKVYPIERDGQRIFEVDLSLTSVSGCARVSHRERDLFGAVEHAFFTLRAQLCPEAPPVGGTAAGLEDLYPTG
ncbi:MAG: hypothetical protein ACODAG_06845 [Myxococcota bacterium]